MKFSSQKVNPLSGKSPHGKKHAERVTACFASSFQSYDIKYCMCWRRNQNFKLYFGRHLLQLGPTPLQLVPLLKGILDSFNFDCSYLEQHILLFLCHLEEYSTIYLISIMVICCLFPSHTIHSFKSSELMQSFNFQYVLTM